MTEKPDAALIDFAAITPTPYVSYAARLPTGGVIISRCIFPPNPGVTLGSTQSVVAIHSGPAFELEWRDPALDQFRSQTIKKGEMAVNRADLPIFHRWTVAVRALVIALENSFVAQTFVQAFDRTAEPLPVIIGAIDPTVQGLVKLCDQEITEVDSAGRLYMEGLATSLVVHLFRTYGSQPYKAPGIVGGLAPKQLRRVLDYIEDCLGQDLGLAELAAMTGLSTHHFGQAFKTSIGSPPHRYLTERRVHRAKELLIGGDRSIAQIAADVGFSSQSHMTHNFHKLTGATPAHYRREFQSKPKDGDELSRQPKLFLDHRPEDD